MASVVVEASSCRVASLGNIAPDTSQRRGALRKRFDGSTLWKAFISMIFIIATHNTPCEQRVSVYRHEVSQGQSETTVATQWKHTCRQQEERSRLAALRSNDSKYNGSYGILLSRSRSKCGLP